MWRGPAPLAASISGWLWGASCPCGLRSNRRMRSSFRHGISTSWLVGSIFAECGAVKPLISCSGAATTPSSPIGLTLAQLPLYETENK